MINLKSEREKQSRRSRSGWLLLWLPIVPAVGLVEQRSWGQAALENWKQQMVAKGETFDAVRLWPPASARSVEFSKQLAQVTKTLPGRLQIYAGGMSGIIPDESGKARRGSQEPFPPINHHCVAVDEGYTWQDLDKLLQQSQPALQRLLELLKDPPTGIDYDIIKRQTTDSLPSFVAHRIAAQTLCASAINNLHRGNLEGATQDLQALRSFGKVGEQDPTLISLMIRMAIMGMSIDVCWDALQTDGWTEPQLAGLQRQCLEVTNVLSQLPRALEAERIARIYELEWFRSHSYPEWVARFRVRYAGSGWQPVPTDEATAVSLWRQGWLNRSWTVAWSEPEELKYMQAVQLELQALREVPHTLSALRLKEEINASRQGYRVPGAASRFYIKLPLADSYNDWSAGNQTRDSSYPYPDYSGAWFVVIKNLTLNEMVRTAIALKRYGLKYGKSPSDLAALVPDFLPGLPHDLMDGQPLRYRLESSGGFTLYSVGEDFQDDGGNAVASTTNGASADRLAWNGKDLVWPRLLPSD